MPDFGHWLYAAGVTAGTLKVRTRKALVKSGRFTWKGLCVVAPVLKWSLVAAAGGSTTVLTAVLLGAHTDIHAINYAFVAVMAMAILLLWAAAAFSYVLFKFMSLLILEERPKRAVNSQQVPLSSGRAGGRELLSPEVPVDGADNAGSFIADTDEYQYNREQMELLRSAGVFGPEVNIDEMMKEGHHEDFDFDRFKQGAKGSEVR